jgi:hypothetical protein
MFWYVRCPAGDVVLFKAATNPQSQPDRDECGKGRHAAVL